MAKMGAEATEQTWCWGEGDSHHSLSFLPLIKAHQFSLKSSCLLALPGPVPALPVPVFAPPGPVLALPGPVPAPPGPVPAPPGPVPAPPGPVLAPPGYTLNSKGECKVSRPQSNTRTELKSVPEPLTSGLTLQNHVVTRVVTHQQPGDTVRKLNGDCQHPKGLV